MRFLVVDDDAMVQQVCQGMLRALNHSSIAVSDAVDAVQHLTESSLKFDCIILDKGLPGLSGIELLGILEEWKISIPVILISGGPLVTEGDESADWAKFPFLAKPFTLSDLRSAIERLPFSG